MKNPLSRARSRPSGEDATTGDPSEVPASEAWTEYDPSGGGPADGPMTSDESVDPIDDPSPAPVPNADDPAGAEPVRASADGDDDGPSIGERVGRLLAVSNRAYLVVAAVALLLGPSAGASARAHLAAAIPRPKPAVVAAPTDDETAADDDVEGDLPAVDDGRRRYLVALEATAGVPTTAAGRTAAPTVPTATTTTTTAPTEAPTAPPVAATLPPPPFPVTVLPGEETQWVDVVRVDASRIAVLMPVRYLQLVRASDAERAAYPIDAGRTLVRDRDGRYWATAADGMDPTLFELAGQLPPPAARQDTTRSTAAAANEGDSTHETTGHETTGHETTGHETTGHETTGHETTGHETATSAHHASTMATIARSTTTTLSPAPPALIEPVPAADRELAIALASLPGVEEVKALGPGVFAVIGLLDPADLESVPGVASVREDTLWTSTRLRR